jgi:uncharacterized membrane protein YgaE (UPF0421/DUF939 family)
MLLMFFTSEASASDIRSDIESLSELAGMADFCQGVFEDASDLESLSKIRNENASISIHAANLFRNEDDHYAANEARKDGYMHYRKFFDGDTGACKRLISTLKLLNERNN